MLWKNWLINRMGSLVIVAGPRQARFFHGPLNIVNNVFKTLFLHNAKLIQIEREKKTVLLVRLENDIPISEICQSYFM